MHLLGDSIDLIENFTFLKKVNFKTKIRFPSLQSPMLHKSFPGRFLVGDTRSNQKDTSLYYILRCTGHFVVLFCTNANMLVWKTLSGFTIKWFILGWDNKQWKELKWKPCPKDFVSAYCRVSDWHGLVLMSRKLWLGTFTKTWNRPWYPVSSFQKSLGHIGFIKAQSSLK